MPAGDFDSIIRNLLRQNGQPPENEDPQTMFRLKQHALDNANPEQSDYLRTWSKGPDKNKAALGRNIGD